MNTVRKQYRSYIGTLILLIGALVTYLFIEAYWLHPGFEMGWSLLTGLAVQLMNGITGGL